LKGIRTVNWKKNSLLFAGHCLAIITIAMGSLTSQLDEWQKAKVIKALPHRSYELQMFDGSIRRRTKKHVRFSREPPLIVSDDGNDIITPLPQPQPTDAAARASGSGVDGRRQPPQPPLPTVAAPTPTQMTKSGRAVRRPARFADYVP